MKFVRVKDLETRHEFDVPEGDWRIEAGLLALVKADRYPPVDRPRRSKPNLRLTKLSAPSTSGAEE